MLTELVTYFIVHNSRVIDNMSKIINTVKIGYNEDASNQYDFFVIIDNLVGFFSQVKDWIFVRYNCDRCYNRVA